ncbi:MAG: hypothetical protein LBE81_13355 [Azonexus sp.]|uniref:FimV/HubP family polar landmark protein n=1 Tax=Azonexus sp. TaxID=1872668 RepID=UPI00281E117C|nr:FimV/HubP family polar landmark protein [Azonexus sp.]MDR0777604.1 hypothetical protein [Azonexus sp.]
MNETNCSKFKKHAAALAVASSLSLTPWLAQAAGLGKITILSGLGQPLRAELAISASPDELSGMTARLAPPEVFRQAGVEYANVPQDLHFALEKRPGGQAVVKVSSVKPVNEPFLDFLVELNWPAGRLVREYTFLLDPPEVVVKQAQQRAPAVDTRVVETVRGGSAKPAAASEDPGTIMPRGSSPSATPARVAETAPKGVASGAASGQTRVVKPGDTLRKIASEMQHEGVSLEQMLVGLYRHNPEAFSGNNMNRLRAGAIIGLPDQETVAAIPEAEARRVFNTQANDWNAYRRKLAAAAAAQQPSEADASQTSGGTVKPRVEDTTPPAEQARDQVKVARTDAASASAAAGKAAAEAEADRIARDKALKEGQERVAMLERNVAELQKLLEFKNQQLAEMQQQAAQKETAKPVEPPKPVESAPVVEPPKVEEVPPVAETAPMPDTTTETPEVVAPVAPPEPPKEQPKPKTPPPTPEPEPEPEPDLLDSVFGDPLLLAGGAGALAALLAGGYFFYRRRRVDDSTLQAASTPALSSLGPNSVFRMTGGQSIDTGNAPPQTGDFSQTGPGTIDTDEVDPVAEADVYMAYGRDTQAEEILLEALQKDPQRLAIHVKLLEIYANRRSIKQFETLASELYAQTGGAGPEWEKVATLGASLDPQNPLYSGAAAKAPAFDANAPMAAAPADTGRTTVAMAAGALAQMAAAGGPAEPSRPAPVEEEEERDTLVLGQPLLAEPPATVQPEPFEEQPVDLNSLDFDLGVPQAGARPVLGAVTETPAATRDDDVALDFDISGDVPLEAAATVVGDLRLPDRDSDKIASAFGGSAATRSGSNDGGGHDFSAAGTLVMPPQKNDIGLPMEVAVSTFVGDEEKAKEPAKATASVRPAADLDAAVATTAVNPVSGGFDMAAQIDTLSGELGDATLIAPEPFVADFGRDDQKMVETMLSPATDADGVEFDVSLTDSVFLGEPMVPPEFDIGSINLDLAAAPASAPAAPARDTQWEEVNTKFDLAKAYEEMGDLEGARELLQEVLAEGSPELVEQAKAVLARIGE